MVAINVICSNAVFFFSQAPRLSQLSVASAGSGSTVSTEGRKLQLDCLIVLGEKSGIVLEYALIADSPTPPPFLLSSLPPQGVELWIRIQMPLVSSHPSPVGLF